MFGGYAGKLLFVDLTTGTITQETGDETVYRTFVGGTGLGVRILFERTKAGADPLGPENMLGFVTGPLTAAGVSGGGRFTVVTKSPVTRGWTDSNSGGYWGPELKLAGYDGVFFTGASPKPVYLLVTPGQAELRDASHLWGKDTYETDDTLQKELVGQGGWRIACIGPSGENRSLMAGIVNEKGRIAARAGVGAVMGSKKLKAIAVGSQKGARISVADPKMLKAVQTQYVKDLTGSPFHQGLTAVGTGGGTSFLLSIGDCPTKNWNTTGTESMPTCANLDSGQMDRYKLRGYGCHSCPIRCGALINVQSGPFATREEMHRPEYETLAAFGPLCLNDNVEAVIKANEICNLFGMDTIAVGGVIAFAMECYENGLISTEDADGLELNWGNGAALAALTDKIARREGIGELLSDGVMEAARRIGKGAEEYAMHVGGHRMPFHDPRLSPSTGTYYIADASPACHMGPQGMGLLEMGQALGSDPILQPEELQPFGDYDRKGGIYARGSAHYQLLSSSGLCALYAIGFAPPVVELLKPVTGWDLDWNEGIQIGKRILTLRQAFNVREGIQPLTYDLPKRFQTPLQVGPAAGQRVEFSTLRKGYFESMGWNIKTGEPDRQTLVDLGLDDLVGGC
jgi:aldehyde:ferredoxin oxidoreductase